MNNKDRIFQIERSLERDYWRYHKGKEEIGNYDKLMKELIELRIAEGICPDCGNYGAFSTCMCDMDTSNAMELLYGGKTTQTE